MATVVASPEAGVARCEQLMDMALCHEEGETEGPPRNRQAQPLVVVVFFSSAVRFPSVKQELRLFANLGDGFASGSRGLIALLNRLLSRQSERDGIRVRWKANGTHETEFEHSGPPRQSQGSRCRSSIPTLSIVSIETLRMYCEHSGLESSFPGKREGEREIAYHSCADLVAIAKRKSRQDQMHPTPRMKVDDKKSDGTGLSR